MNKEEIQSLIKGDVFDDENTLQSFSKDASVFMRKPALVVAPKTKEDISSLIRFVSNLKEKGEDVSLSARAAGTCMSGGSLTNSLLLDFKPYFNKVLEVGDSYAVGEMGVFYRDFEKETLQKGLLFPSYPASRELCALGGIVNNNSAGEKTLRYGKTEDYLEEVEVVLADGSCVTFKEESVEEWQRVCREDISFYGDIHRKIDSLLRGNGEEIEKNKPTVSKNSSGYYLWRVYNKDTKTYNLAKLICGAQGTLGIVTHAKLRLVPKEDFSRMLVVFLKDVSSIPSVVSEVLPLAPESFELYDDHTFKIAMKFWRDIAKRMGGSLLSLGIQFLPEFKMVLTGGVPKVVLLAEFTGASQEEVDEQVRIAALKIEALQKSNPSISSHIVGPQEAKKYWTFRRESFNLLRSKLSDMRTAPFIEDVVIHKDDFPTFFPEFEKLLDEYNLIYTIAGHVGDGNLHVIPLMKLSEEKNIETIKELSEKVYALVEKYHGYIW
jgi:FAD/FMN-containing dehydrogenase